MGPLLPSHGRVLRREVVKGVKRTQDSHPMALEQIGKVSPNGDSELHLILVI